MFPNPFACQLLLLLLPPAFHKRSTFSIHSSRLLELLQWFSSRIYVCSLQNAAAACFFGNNNSSEQAENLNF